MKDEGLLVLELLGGIMKYLRDGGMNERDVEKLLNRCLPANER